MKHRIANTIFCGGKNYHMEITDNFLVIYEKYQDEFNVWHLSITPRYFISGDEIPYLFFDVGSDKMHNILSYLRGVKAI